MAFGGLIPLDRILVVYWNRNTGTKTIALHFMSEKERDEHLNMVDENFRHYSVP